MTEPAHDDTLCAASNADDVMNRPEDERCLDGEVYGPCGHENCYGICDWQGQCRCCCHGPRSLGRYAALINAPLPCTTAREIGSQIAGGDYPRYKVSQPPRQVVAEKVVFVDGPVAGMLRPVPDEWISYMVSVPRPIRFGIGQPVTALDDTACYSISGYYYYDHAGSGTRIAFRAGSANGSQPGRDVLAEHGLTGLAEQGLIPWADVPGTELDRTTPITVMMAGDPLADCSVKVSDPFHLPTGMLQATCACGWATDYDIPMARRAQLVRAAYKHAAGQDRRRELYKRPIVVLHQGSGATATCYAGIRADKVTGKIYGICRECGFETETVEDFRRGRLWDLCKPHTGPDGVRKVRNQLLVSYGLPLPEGEDA
jgi:hypothetical protein